MRHFKTYLLLLIARELYRSALRKHRKATARMRWANAVLSQAAYVQQRAHGLKV